MRINPEGDLMRLVISVLGLCIGLTAFAAEWEEAQRLQSFEQLEEFWILEHIPVESYGRISMTFNEPLRVDLDLLVKSDGSAEARITGSSGNEGYDSAVRDAVSRHRYRPTEENDPPRAVIVPYYRSITGPRTAR